MLIADGIARAAHADGGHTVHIAGRQTAETAVAEARIVLLLEDIGHLIAHILKRFGHGRQNTQIIGIVAQAAANQKFHAQVVHLTLSVLFHFVLGFHHMLGERIAHDERAGFVNLLLGGILDLTAEVALQLACDRFLQRGFCVLILWHGTSNLLT